MFRTLGTKRWVAWSLRLTGHAVRLQGDLERAAGLYRESVTLFGETGDKWVATECIEGLALIASAQGRSEQAVRLFGVAEAARETFGITMPRPEAGDQEHVWAAIRERTERTTFVTAWAEDRAMTLEQGVEYALAAREGVPLTGSTQPAGADILSLLTPREREVAELVGRGLSNREIAQTLVIAERTAESHVQHILDKLGLSSRGRIAAWAVNHGLHKPTQS